MNDLNKIKYLVKKIILPDTNRFIYWLFVCLGFLINIADGATWFGWIFSPIVFGWFAIGLKALFVFQAPLEFRYQFGKRIDVLVAILIGILLIALIVDR